MSYVRHIWEGVRPSIPDVTSWVRRAVVATMAMTCTTVAAVAVAEGPAWADSGDYGLVWNASPTLADHWFTTSGRMAHIVRSSTGTYTVTLIGRATSGGNAEVSAITTGSQFCQVASWYPSGADEVVNVVCFSATGAAADVQFQLNFVYRSGTGGRYAYAWASNPWASGTYTPSPWYAYDSTGGTPLIYHGSTGFYWVYLPATAGIPWGSIGESFQATAYGYTPAHCQVSSSMHSDGWQEVMCTNTAGAPLDTYFSVSFASQRSFIGISGGNYAYAWIDGTVSPPGGPGIATTVWAYNAAGATGTAAAGPSQLGTGRYLVKLYGAMTADEPFPVAYATNGYNTYCSVYSWATSGTTEIVEVSCVDAATHLPAQSAFMLQFVGLPH